MLPAEYLIEPTWNLPRATRGDAASDTLYLAVGKALSQWETLEIELGQLFAVLVESPSQAASRAYGVVASALGRRDLLEKAAEVYFAKRSEDDYTTFDNLMKALKHASTCRNNIAHGHVREYAAPDMEGGGFYLVAPDYNTRRTVAFIDLSADSADPFAYSRHRYAYTATQVTEVGGRFAVLAREANNLARQLNRRPKAGSAP